MTATLCPNCGIEFSANSDGARKLVRCPQCGEYVEVLGKSTSFNWLLIGLILTSLSIGLFGGLRLGWQKSYSQSSHEFQSATSQLKAKQESLHTAEAELGSAELELTTLSETYSRAVDDRTIAEKLLADLDAQNVGHIEQIEKLTSSLTKSNQQLADLQSEKDDLFAQLQNVSNVAKTKRAESSEKQGLSPREAASRDALVKLQEHRLQLDPVKDSLATFDFALRRLVVFSHLYTRGEKVGDLLLGSKASEHCVAIVRVAGDLIPKGSKYTLAESWAYALKGD